MGNFIPAILGILSPALTQEIINDENISKSNEEDEIFTGVIKGEISLEDIETYLKTFDVDRRGDTHYRKLLVAYDFKKYTPSGTQWG